MPDVHDRATRSRNMAAIRGKNTNPELTIRRLLHKQGYRYRLHDKSLPGKPDLIFPRYNAVIFIHGCFWHKHECHLFKWPESRQEFWQTKITRNAEKDAESAAALSKLGWRVMNVWECALKGKKRLSEDETVQAISKWLESDRKTFELRG